MPSDIKSGGTLIPVREWNRLESIPEDKSEAAESAYVCIFKILKRELHFLSKHVIEEAKPCLQCRTTGIRIAENGLVSVDDCGRTSRKWVFASGEVVTGAKTVVEAVKVSKKVAEAIDRYLSETQPT